MTEEKNEGLQPDNQVDLPLQTEETTDEQVTPPVSDESEVSESSEETIDATSDDKPEFTDENMQSRFTERMTELKTKEKEFDDKLSQFGKKAEAFDKLASLPEFRDWYQNYSKSDTPKQPEITDEEYYQATQDKSKFQEVVSKLAESKIQGAVASRIDELERKYESDRLANEIDSFADAIDDNGKPLHPDFWELDEQKKIEPYLMMFQKLPLSGMQKIEMAYKLAKFPKMQQEVISKAYNLAEKKKQMSTDKGVSNESVVSKSRKGKTVEEVFNDTWKELGFE